MAYNIRLEGKNLLEAERLLEEVVSTLDSCGIQYWLEGGTLLGIVRENRLLPWDNDLDISIHENQLSNLKKLLSELKKKKFRVRVRRFEENSDVFKKNAPRIIKIRRKTFFGLLKGSVCLEIFVKYTYENITYWKIGNITQSVPYKYYSLFTKKSFKNKDYSIPKNTDEYLTYRYRDWKTPVKEWDTFKDDGALS